MVDITDEVVVPLMCSMERQMENAMNTMHPTDTHRYLKKFSFSNVMEVGF